MSAKDSTAGFGRLRRAWRPGALALLLLIGLAGLGQWLVDRWSHVHVDDSRIAANVVAVSSEAAGRVSKIPVVAGDRVRRGDLLARIDSRQAELLLAETDGEIARLQAERSQLQAQQAMIRRQVASRLAAGRAELEAAQAGHEAAQADLGILRRDQARLASLSRDGAVSVREFEGIEGRFQAAQQQALRRAAEVRTAQAQLAVIEAETAELDVLERRIAALDAQKTVLEARRASQLVDLGHRELGADFDGVVDAAFVDAGEYVTPGTRLLMYHDPRDVWVEANVKETDFRKLKTGARATITVDAYPGRSFQGEVTHLGNAATSLFALLPSPNPSGNFTKVTQRLPVRISIENDGLTLRPGMMVEVKIRVAD